MTPTFRQLDAAAPDKRIERTGADAVARFFDAFAPVEEKWRRRAATYHLIIASIYRFIVPRGASVLEIGCGSGTLLAALEPSRGIGIDVSGAMIERARHDHPGLEFVTAAGEDFVTDEEFDYVIVSDLVPYADDLIAVFRNVASMSHARTRVIVESYSALWRPAVKLAELLRLKPRKPIQNWVSPDDVRNLFDLVDCEVVSVQGQILFPWRVPFLTTFLNGVVAHIWPFSLLTLTYWVVGRPKAKRVREEAGVSVVVPCRNEEGTIDEIVRRIPELGSGTEIIFVEGGSSDDTRRAIERVIAANPKRAIRLVPQTGIGKGDAVRCGFAVANQDVLMILDGDLSVAPEVLPAFYETLVTGRADLVNGSRLVYGREPSAMRFLNLLGNKFFSYVFGWLMKQRVKDTLCGTKVLRRRDYEQIAAGRTEFGEFDPFGDFDLLLGGARLGMKIVDLPVRYHPRTYGRTNISRFRHGVLLLQMSFLGFHKLKVVPVRLR